MHTESRTQHPKYTVARIEVPDNKVAWKQPFNHYIDFRPFYNHPDVETNLKLKKDDPKRWAESHSITETDKENLKSRITNIHGYPETLEEAGIIFDGNNLPINPIGRTGLYGTGLLGKNGPNQAADPIFTRWAPPNTKPFYIAINNLKHILTATYQNPVHLMIWELIKSLFYLLPHLQMIAIQRQDTRDWAIPGGMVEDGQTVSQTLKNEINEEACNNMDPNNASKEIDEIFNKNRGILIYRGYADDPRNVDTRWLETTAVHYHCESKLAAAIKLKAGDDARKVMWLDMIPFDTRYYNLYAHHKRMTDKAMLQILIPYYVYNIIGPIIVFKLSNSLLAYFD
jgi:ADP-ribose pyrophosphatase